MVGPVVAIGVAQEEDLRQREHDHTAVDELDATRPVHAREDRARVQAAIIVRVLQDDEPAGGRGLLLEPRKQVA
jgi:hypothetical protein